MRKKLHYKTQMIPVAEKMRTIYRPLLNRKYDNFVKKFTFPYKGTIHLVPFCYLKKNKPYHFMRYLLLLTVIVFASCSTKEADKLFSQGADYLKEGKLDSAFIYLSDAEQMYTDDEQKGHVKIYLGSLMRELGAYDKSTEYYLEAIDLIKSNRLKAAAFKNVGRVLALSGKMDEAELYIKQAIRMYSDKDLINKAYNTLAFSYYINEMYTKAKKTYMHLLNTGYDKSKLYNNLGALYIDMKNDSADYYLNQSLELAGYSSTYANLARLTGNRDHAHKVDGVYKKEALELLAKSDNKDSVIYYQNAQIEYLAGKVMEKDRIERLHHFYIIQARMKLNHQQHIITVAIAGGVVLLLVLVNLLYVVRKKRKKRIAKGEEILRKANQILERNRVIPVID